MANTCYWWQLVWREQWTPEFYNHIGLRSKNQIYIWVTEWNKLDCCIRNADSFKVFKKRLLSFIRPMLSSIYNIHNPLGVKYLTRLRIGFSHLKEHKFKRKFQDSIDPMCSCSSGIFISFSNAQILIFKDKTSLTK